MTILPPADKLMRIKEPLKCSQGKSMLQRFFVSSFSIGLICVGLSSAASAQPSGVNTLQPTAGNPLNLRAGNMPIRVSLVADGIIGPWDIEFLPDGAILVNEMSGRMRIIRDGELKAEPVWVSPSPSGNDVLHGIAVHPDFQQNSWIYVSYMKAMDNDPGLVTAAVSRGRLVNDRLVDVEEIFVADAWGPARMAFTGRMQFGPDNTLYMTVGDRDGLCCGPVDDNSVRIRAQSLANHIGKTLRLTDDGGVPDDNPFVGNPDAMPEIYTYGNRNGYGLEFHPETGELWQLEIGQSGSGT